jgi:hypothetical protein
MKFRYKFGPEEDWTHDSATFVVWSHDEIWKKTIDVWSEWNKMTYFHSMSKFKIEFLGVQSETSVKVVEQIPNIP